MDLFETASNLNSQPLAHRMRPETLDEYTGQEHIVSPGRLLRRMIQADQISSIIFYGPPGTGKTTLARVIANSTKSSFSTMNAVLSGVKELREEIASARERLSLHGRRTILFIDEIHRWNKAQQDALLPWVENGTIILIGATTQNPYFEVNPALVSRSRIFQLKPLEADNLKQIARQTLENKTRGYGKYNIEFEPGALEHLIDIANGDARSLLNALELAVETSTDVFPPEEGAEIFINLETAEESIQKKVVLYDKEGDYHFDIISAFIKSIRGSDPDATLYWLARMVSAGEDPRFIFRRMLISASEDIGMADPNGLVVAEAAASAFDRVGMPEGRYHLTQAALYLSTAPKSNSALGFFDALRSVETGDRTDVPNHLKDPGRDKKGFGHGEGYLYPHAFREHWVAQQYLPDSLEGKVFYEPSETGYEAAIRDEVLRKREAGIESASRILFPEVLTTSPPDKSRDRWFERMLDGRSVILKEIQNDIFEMAGVSSHSTVLDLNPGSGMLLWEAARRIREGGVYGIAENSDTAEYLRRYSSFLPELERPVILESLPDKAENEDSPGKFDIIIGRNAVTRLQDKLGYIEKIMALNSLGGRLVLAETVPAVSPRLSQFLPDNDFPGELKQILVKTEKKIYDSGENPLTSWNSHDLQNILTSAGYGEVKITDRLFSEKRTITANMIDSWFSPDGGEFTYGKIISEDFNAETNDSIKKLLKEKLAKTVLDWQITVCTASGTVI